MTQEKLEFDLTPQELAVTIGGKDYVLREASAEAARQYRNASTKGMKFDGNGKPMSLGDSPADAESLLVSMCLFERYEHNGQTKDRPVQLSTVKTWPDRVAKNLFAKCKELSPSLEAGEDKDSLKNAPTPSTDTSS